ncbi:hypothetical protein [Burkholderia cenocepacia]|uniref:Uncharacterized protein n=1 Tax=Burkholderia cenocepacia (strain ATCC BAA-245 / DSM 16553 / LMG 16656 / NCTC 13227 / J2315 / CF5610) TaxID=216591 RepID=B4EQP9_BURCJ|nr:hypothetical protein [Burkholderia cenocepacia]KIS46035.1 hypothetical protein NP88_7321 [Burkholderia cepacia]EPZ84531.1 hypothetical protein BURCENK562V_C0072 [Burkholderia cenocepacia K56-2Valvano]ERI28631.1 hypothetical protein BURCENBC7_AP0268 [Burkholderia cenocepacia BC7]QKT93094.1 hypothetical protein FOC42_14870 [Burkholderia cenocepacia]QNN09329.1 hypothetical protein K562_40018 [Burkholderia cenocepacia]
MKLNNERFVVGTRGWDVAEAKRVPAGVARATLQNATWRIPISGAPAPVVRERDPS